MSIKQELNTAREEVKILSGQISFYEGMMLDERERQSKIMAKLEILKTRKSELARAVTANVEKELQAVNQKSEDTENTLAQLIGAKRDLQSKISQMENDVGLYIEEQSSLLCEAFWEFVKENQEKLGTDIKKTFQIKEITERLGRMHGDCEIPTGNIGIYDESEKCFVATTLDGEPFFGKKLYDILCDGYDHAICKHTEWYKKYLLNFKVRFFAFLQQQYCFEDSFELTINNPYFTLELV